MGSAVSTVEPQCFIPLLLGLKGPHGTNERVRIFSGPPQRNGNRRRRKGGRGNRLDGVNERAAVRVPVPVPKCVPIAQRFALFQSGRRMQQQAASHTLLLQHRHFSSLNSKREKTQKVTSRGGQAHLLLLFFLPMREESGYARKAAARTDSSLSRRSQGIERRCKP